MSTLLLSEVFPPQTGGSGRWFWEIYRRLPREDHLVAAGSPPGCDAFDQQHDLRIRRFPLRMPEWGIRSARGLRDYAQLTRRLRCLVRAERISVVHAGRCLPEGWLAWILHWCTGARYLVYVHGEDIEGAALSREHSWMVRRIFARATCLIANSQNTAKLLENWGVPQPKVRVLHPGVDTERFRPAPRAPIVRRVLGWHGRPVVLTVGRLQKRKGHDHLILALPDIRRRVPDVLYAIVGDGEERGALEQLVEREGLRDHVQFLSEVDEAMLVKCYQQCDVFALPNRTVGRDIEGFGMVLLEAQACGRPVLAGASGGTAETMRVPETGRLVSADRPTELVGPITDLLLNEPLRHQMGAAGRQWVVENFDWTSLAAAAQRLFGEIPSTVNRDRSRPAALA